MTTEEKIERILELQKLVGGSDQHGRATLRKADFDLDKVLERLEADYARKQEFSAKHKEEEIPSPPKEEILTTMKNAGGGRRRMMKGDPFS